MLIALFILMNALHQSVSMNKLPVQTVIIEINLILVDFIDVLMLANHSQTEKKPYGL